MEPILEDTPITDKGLSVSEPLLQTIKASDQPTASSNVPCPASPMYPVNLRDSSFSKPETKRKKSKHARK